MFLWLSFEIHAYSADQEIPIFLRNRDHESPPFDPTLSQLNLVNSLTSCFSRIPFNIILSPLMKLCKNDEMVGASSTHGMRILVRIFEDNR